MRILMNLFRPGLMAIVALLIGMSAGWAQSSIQEPDRILLEFDEQTVARFFEELNLPAEVSASRKGAPVFLVAMPGGGKFVTALTVCDPGQTGRCLGAYFIAYFDPGSADTLAVGNRYDAAYPLQKHM